MDDDDDARDETPWLNRERNVETLVAQIEQERVRDAAWAAHPGPSFVRLRPPVAWQHPITGRRELEPEPRLVLFGRYLRHGRALAGFSQAGLGNRADVTQSMISRAERGLAPAMGLDPLTRLGEAMGRAFPLGFCPHEHRCAWQPVVPRAQERTHMERLTAILLGRDHEEP